MSGFSFKSRDTKPASNNGVTFELKVLPEYGMPIMDTDSGDNPYEFYNSWLQDRETALDNDGKPMTVTLYGSSSDSLADTRKRLVAKALASLPAKKKTEDNIPESKQREIEQELIKAAIKEWHVVYDDKAGALDCNDENKELMLGVSDFKEQILVYQGYTANFLPKPKKG